MDSLRYLCKISNNLKVSDDDYKKLEEYTPFTSLIISPSIPIKVEENLSILPSKYIIKNSDYIDNFHLNIGKSMFTDHSAVVLANIDTIFSIFNKGNTSTHDYLSENAGMWAPQNLANAEFYPKGLHINAEGPGFIEYMQYKYPFSYNYIITGNISNFKVLDRTKYIMLTGDNRTGDIKKEYASMIKRVLYTEKDGLDIVVFNSEPYDVDLLLSYYIAFKTLKKGGKFIFKLNCSDGRYQQYLNILPEVFGEISIFKPSSIDLFNPYIYVICNKYKGENAGVSDYILSVINLYLKEMDPENRVINKLYPDLHGINNYVKSELKKLVDFRNEIKNTKDKYFPQRLLIYMNLPGTPEKE